MSENFENFKLDLLGVISLSCGDTALAAIRCCVFERRYSAYLSPGMFFVGMKLLKRTDGLLAETLAPGPRDKCGEVVGLLSTGKFSYMGLCSGTNVKVESSIGEAMLYDIDKKREKLPEEEKESKRPTKVHVIQSFDENLNKIQGNPIKRTRLNYRDVIPSIISIINLGAFSYSIWLNDIIGALVIIIGAMTNMLLTFAASASGCSYPSVKVASGSPPGNAVVTNDLQPNQFWIVLGDEVSVQTLLQRPITVELNSFWKLVNIFAGITAFIYTIFIILAFPLVTIRVQIIIGGLLILGLLANMTYTIRGDELLIRKIKKGDVVEYKETLTFPSRTAAVAYCVLRCKSDAKHTNKLLPTTPTFDLWRKLLTHLSNLSKKTIKGDSMEKKQEVSEERLEVSEEELEVSEGEPDWESILQRAIKNWKKIPKDAIEKWKEGLKEDEKSETKKDLWKVFVKDMAKAINKIKEIEAKEAEAGKETEVAKEAKAKHQFINIKCC